MKIIQPAFEIWLQEPGKNGIYRQVERAGRVCYKSEDRRTETSAQPFVAKMIKNKHTAMLEHATVYLTLPSFSSSTGKVDEVADRYHMNRFSRVQRNDEGTYITTNLRVLADNEWMDDLDYLTEPTPRHERRITVHFTTQVAITREFNRHRANSMAEQSTRYCNYSRAKFGNEITLNLPGWVNESAQNAFADDLAHGTLNVDTDAFISLSRRVCSGDATAIENWVFANAAAEKAYMNLIAAGLKPQEARVVLPLDVNTELVHTAFVSDWLHFFDLRAKGTTGAPHPDAKALAMPLYEEFKRLKLI